MLTKKFYKTKDEAEVTFEYSCDDVDSVSLVAEFNDWEPLEMTYSKKLKVYRTKVRLPKDNDFHFRYLINDTEWVNDHEADKYLPNEFGTDNSVVSTYA